MQAIIVGRNGVYLPGTFFAHLFKDYDHVIRQYQVIQDEAGAITLRVVKALRFEEAAFRDILALLRRYLGEETRIDVQFAERIEMVHTGKQQGSISRLKIDLQSSDWRELQRGSG